MKNPEKLLKTYHYEVLPYQVYSDRDRDKNEVYLFNMRVMFLEALEKEMLKC